MEKTTFKNNIWSNSVHYFNWLRESQYSYQKQPVIYIHKNISTINALTLGINWTHEIPTKSKNKLLKSKVPAVLYLLGTENINNNYDYYNKIIFQGTHGSKKLKDIDIILPTVTPYSLNTIYMSFFQKLIFTTKIIRKLTETYSNTLYILNMFIGFNKHTNHKSLFLKNRLYFNFSRKETFQEHLFNNILNITPVKNYTILPFQYLSKINLSTQIDKISFSNIILIKALFEKIIAIESMILKIEKYNVRSLQICSNMYQELKNIGIKDKLISWDLYKRNCLIPKPRNLYLEKHNLVQATINFLQKDTILGSSVILSLGWLRITSKSNNYK